MEKVRLIDVCEINIGNTPSRNNSDYWGKGFPWVSISDMSENKYISKTKEEITEKALINCRCKLIKPGVVLFSFKLSIGKVCISEVPLFTNEAIVSLPIKDSSKLNRDYLYYVLKSLNVHHLAERAAKGATLNKAKLENIEIPLPSIEIQKSIVDCLDQADVLRHKDLQILTLYDELTKSIFLDMFGDPILDDKGWGKRNMMELYSKKREGTKCGPFGSALKKAEYTKLGIPVWVMDNIQNDKFDPKGCLYITEQKYNELKSYSVELGDIIISRAGTVGKMCVIDKIYDKSIISTNLIKLSLDPEIILPLYFVCLFTYFKGKIARLRTGADEAFTHMNTGVLNELTFTVPPLELQIQFTKVVSQIEQQKAILQQQIKQSEALFQRLLQDSFSN